jgi:hypothetical protein
MPGPNEKWQVRTPWPDEMVRLARHFKIDPRVDLKRCSWLWVIEVTAPERIVGLAVLHERHPLGESTATTNPEVHLTWDVRSAWQEHTASETLLDTALKQAGLSTAQRVITTLPADGILSKLAMQRGFTEHSRQEVWRIPVAAALAHLNDRGSKVLAHIPVDVSPIHRTPLDQIRKICSETKLLLPHQVRPSAPGVSGGFDPQLSFSAGDPANPDAILLGREQSGTAYLEVLARNQETPNMHFTGVIALLRAFFQATAALGLDEATCAVRSGSNFGLVPLARRAGGQRQESAALFQLDLAPRNDGAADFK